MGGVKEVSFTVLTAACLVACSAAICLADEFFCNIPTIGVSAEEDVTAQIACDVAVATDARLRSLGLSIDEQVLIEVTREMDVAPGICVALYSTTSKKLQVLPVDCLAGQPGRAKPFPAMSADLLFESLIVHELVHAYLDQLPEGRILPRIAHEYMAYAIQLDALPEQERQRIIAQAAVQSPIELTSINEAILNMSPLRFAAMAWLHFRQEGGNAALVRRVVDGSLGLKSLRE